MRAFATSSVKVAMLVQRCMTPGVAGLVSATSGMSSPPSTALTTAATLPLWMQCEHGYSGCIGVVASGCQVASLSGAGVPLDIAVAICRDGPPEVVMVFGVQHSDDRVVESNRLERHEACAVEDTHLLCGHELAHQGLIGQKRTCPEQGCLGLLGRSLRTDLSAIVLDLVEVCRPLFAVQRNRRIWPKLRRTGHGEWLHVRPH